MELRDDRPQSVQLGLTDGDASDEKRSPAAAPAARIRAGGQKVASEGAAMPTTMNVVGLLDLDLAPGAGSASGVRQVSPFRDDALESQLTRSREKFLARLFAALDQRRTSR